METQRQYDHDYQLVQDVRDQKIRVYRNDEQVFEENWEITWINSREHKLMVVRQNTVKSGLREFKWVPFAEFFEWQESDQVAQIISRKIEVKEGSMGSEEYSSPALQSQVNHSGVLWSSSTSDTKRIQNETLSDLTSTLEPVVLINQ